MKISNSVSAKILTAAGATTDYMTRPIKKALFREPFYFGHCLAARRLRFLSSSPAANLFSLMETAGVEPASEEHLQPCSTLLSPRLISNQNGPQTAPIWPNTSYDNLPR